MNRKMIGNITFGIAIAVFVLLAVVSFLLVGHPRQGHSVDARNLIDSFRSK